MIVHYLKISFRNIFRDSVYSLINLIGLSVAMACCFLLIFWIKFELTYEDNHKKANRIYKVLEVEKRADGLFKKEWIRPGIARQLKETFPEIEASTVVSHESLPFVYENGEGIMVDYVSATTDFLEMFDCEFLEGSKENVLKSNGAIVSDVMAKKFFGEEPAIGKTINFGENHVVCTIQAVVKIPQNTHVKFDVLSMSRMSNYGVHYILIQKNVRFSEETQQRLTDFLKTSRSTENKLSFQPIREVHLYSPKELAGNSYWQTFGDLKQIYLFSGICLLILIIAVINYVNTSTARAISRLREVSIRKVTGSTQRQLILRFLTDAFIISAAAIVLALIGAKAMFPQFSSLMGNRVAFVMDFSTMVTALAVCLVTTLLSGGYAAFYLSSFSPLSILRGGAIPGSREVMRKFLIGFQFFLSIGILISTSLIYRQIRYMFTAETGIDYKNVLILDTNLWYGVDDFIQLIKRENPNIIDATIAFGAPYHAQWNYSGVSWEGCSEDVKETAFTEIFCDYHYADMFGLQVIEGQFLQPGGNRNEIVINEAFRKMMGTDNPVGMTIIPGDRKIIGVVRDFNFKPLKEPITPLIMSFNHEAVNKVYIKTTGNDHLKTLDYILTKYREMSRQITANKMPVMYHTVEDDFNAMYNTELRTLKMLTVFSALSICLCLMGIFSVISFMVEKRRKEIAIRRINGAATTDIITLFINYFWIIIGGACLIAVPASYFIHLRWIETYAFRTTSGWWIFVLVPLIVSLITAMLIALQVVVTTRQNPAEVVKM